jgi:carboxypeptidase family protein
MEDTMRRLFFLSLVLLLAFLPTLAQDTATIVGTVMDSSGSVIPQAKVKVTNFDKGFTREVVSNSAGEYSVPKIPLGNYEITAEAPGFRKLVHSGIQLAVGQTLRVDLRLQVGRAAEVVNVTGNIAKTETEAPTVSAVITGKEIANLQLDAGRNFFSLSMIGAGASPSNYFNGESVGIFGNTLISFNGRRYEYNNVEVDGGNITDEGSNATLNVYPSLDSIAEFRATTSNAGADIGKHAGALIEAATKSGTREFHGMLFEYIRNDHLDANDWFVNRQRWSGLDVARDCGGNPAGPCNAPKRPLKWNDYGYNLGGPVFIPGHYNTDKSRTFFFWSQNWRKNREGAIIGATVPTMRMRNGDFSECDPASANFNPAVSNCALPINPDTGALFPGNQVPMDPNAKALLDGLVPLPNNGVMGYLKAPSVPMNWRQELVRVDHNLTERTRVFVRYIQDGWTQVSPGLWAGGLDNDMTTADAPGKSAVLNLSHTFSPNLVNEFIMAYTEDRITLTQSAGPGSPAHSLDKPSTWTANNLFPANRDNPLLPSFWVDGYLYASAGWPYVNSNPIITMKDNLNLKVRAHNLKFGFFLERYQKKEQFGLDPQGSMGFAADGPYTTGNALADMFLGHMYVYQEGTTMRNGQPAGGFGWGQFRMTAFEPYFQDDWRVSSKLHLSLGLRYHLFTRMHDVSNPTIDTGFMPQLYDPGKEALLDLGGNLVLDPATGHTHDYTTYGNGLVQCGVGSIAKGCVTPNYATLAPRFGFAFDPAGNGKTVIRGGYGIYYDMGNGNEANAEGSLGNPPSFLYPATYFISGYQNIVPGALAPASLKTLPYHQKWSSVQQFNLGIQHQFTGNDLLSLSYVGSLGRHLGRGREMNQVPIGVGFMNAPELVGPDRPEGCDATGLCDVQDMLINQRTARTHFVPYRGYDSIARKENSAISHYDALQASFRHAFGGGLAVQTSYTWSHTIDDASSPYSTSGVDDSNLSRWRATSDLNRTHMLAVSYIYEMPFFKNSTRALTRSLLGGWNVSGVGAFVTGTPIDFGCGIAGLSSGIGGGVRCNSLGKLQIRKGVVNDPEFGPTPTWFDPNMIGQVTLDQLRADGQPGMFGYMGRNPLTGPGIKGCDMALLKDFELPWFGPERSQLQFRWETFNTFNHPQWLGVNAGCGNLTPPGAPCGDAQNNLRNAQVNSAGPPRIMQFGLKLIF